MAPLIPSAKITLSYPLYACDFDPLDSSRLVVGGGGGAGKNGVGNKITLLDTSDPKELSEIGEIDLSKEEDNVTSLAVGGQGNKTIVYAGANSSPKDVGAGKNSHFHVFEIKTASKAKGKGKETEKEYPYKISEISRNILFKGVDKDQYQRLLRLSKPVPNQSQLGAVSTGLTKDPEIVLFDTGENASPPTSRGAVRGGREAVDFDILQISDDEYLFAYCDIFDVFVKKISKSADEEEPKTVYMTPASRSTENVTVPQFRGLRWLTKDSVLMLTNIHSTGGAVLQLLRLPPSGKWEWRVAKSHRLPDRISKASALAVSNLTPPLSPSDSQDYTQFVIAVAAQDRSISLFKIDLQAEIGVTMYSKIKPFKTLWNVHPHQITGITFSNFEPPPVPITAKTPPQTLKLASVGVSNTLVVHTLPLFPVPLSMRRGQSKTPRYVAALPSSAVVVGLSIGLITFGVLLLSILIQGVLEIRGVVPSYIDARSHVPHRIQEIVGLPYTFPDGYNAIKSKFPDSPHIPVAELLSKIQNPTAGAKTGGDEQKYFITEHSDSTDGLKAHVHDEEIHKGDHWEDLTEEQKEKWVKKLKEAGYWVENMGETILKGVVFGTLGGLVGEAAAAAL